MNIGRIARVIGPVVDVEFEEGKLPSIKNALLISNPAIDDTKDNLVVEVALETPTRLSSQQKRLLEEFLKLQAKPDGKRPKKRAEEER